MRRRLAILAAAVALLGATGCYANLDNTGPTEERCDTTINGGYNVTTDGAVLDHWCIVGGTLEISADNVTVRESQIEALPPGDFVAVFLNPGAHGLTLHKNIIDCGGDTAPENAASQGIRTFSDDVSATVTNNEIRNCSDPIQLMSNTTYSTNYLHLMDNSGDLHADGVQWDVGVHDVLFERNVVKAHGPTGTGSAAFQWHSGAPEAEWAQRVVVRYNLFEGGAQVVSFPGNNPNLCQPATACEGIDNEFYGNRLWKAPASSFWCGGGTHAIDVWGSETGSTADSLPPNNPDGIKDDENVRHEDGSILSRADCGG